MSKKKKNKSGSEIIIALYLVIIIWASFNVGFLLGEKNLDDEMQAYANSINSHTCNRWSEFLRFVDKPPVLVVCSPYSHWNSTIAHEGWHYYTR